MGDEFFGDARILQNFGFFFLPSSKFVKFSRNFAEILNLGGLTGDLSDNDSGDEDDLHLPLGFH